MCQPVASHRSGSRSPSPIGQGAGPIPASPADHRSRSRSVSTGSNGSNTPPAATYRSCRRDTLHAGGPGAESKSLPSPSMYPRSASLPWLQGPQANDLITLMGPTPGLSPRASTLMSSFWDIQREGSNALNSEQQPPVVEMSDDEGPEPSMPTSRETGDQKSDGPEPLETRTSGPAYLRFRPPPIMIPRGGRAPITVAPESAAVGAPAEGLPDAQAVNHIVEMSDDTAPLPGESPRLSPLAAAGPLVRTVVLKNLQDLFSPAQAPSTPADEPPTASR